MTPRHRVLFGVAAVAAVFTAAACSDDSDDGSTPATETPTDASPPRTTAATAVGSTAPSTSASPTSDRITSDGVAIPTITWAACPAALPDSAPTDGFECATATVPMDYDAPDGDTFELALIKHAAGDSGSKIGALFWNPGGPSDAGTQYLPASLAGFPDEVQARFDIVSWDPRGMGGGTTPVVQCFESAEAESEFLATGPSEFPATAEQLAAATAFRSELNRRCVDHAGDIVTHVSTADNARDIDLLRQALGEEQVSYYGTSYGTFLGATFINMFPETVRAAVFDGAVFPTGWVDLDETDPDLTTFLRVGSDQGSAETVAEFMRQCGAVGTDRCAFSAGSPEATTAKWGELLQRIRVTPAALDGQPFDEGALLSAVQSSIYITKPIPGFSRFPGWSSVGDLVQGVWQASEPGATTTTAASTPDTDASGPTTTGASGPQAYTTSAGRQLAVVCGESPNPTSEAAYVDQALASYQRVGLNGWPSVAACSGWTAQAASTYDGPWDAYTNPVLVIGNTFDPATAYTSSQRMAEELADGRFLTVDGFGHTQLLNPSRCAKNAVAAYLIEGTLPADGTRCPQDANPFDS